MPFKINLSLKNLMRKPGRTTALIILSAFLSFAILAGSLVIAGLRSGLTSLTAKLGADIMVVPYEASTKSGLTDIILQGNPGYFYMDNSVVEKLAGMDGVGRISDQFFLASASSGCCSLPVQIIGLDPETDFTIQPWIRTSYRDELGDLEILVGNDLNAFPGDELTFYGTVCRVVGKLDKTGTYLDTSVYASKDTIKTLIVSAKERKLFNFGDVDPDAITSCVLINVADGYSVEEVLNDINIHVRKVEAVRTQNMISDVAEKLTGTADLIGGLILAVWILGLVILVLAFYMISNERRREFAVLRAIGASRGTVASVVLKEALIVSLVGSAAGAALALLVLVAFRNLIEQTLRLPFLLPGALPCAVMAVCAVAAAVAAGSAAAAVCAKRASRIDTAFILRGEN